MNPQYVDPNDGIEFIGSMILGQEHWVVFLSKEQARLFGGRLDEQEWGAADSTPFSVFLIPNPVPGCSEVFCFFAKRDDVADYQMIELLDSQIASPLSVSGDLGKDVRDWMMDNFKLQGSYHEPVHESEPGEHGFMPNPPTMSDFVKVVGKSPLFVRMAADETMLPGEYVYHPRLEMIRMCYETCERINDVMPDPECN